MVRFCNTLDGGDNIAWHRVIQLVIQKETVVATDHEEIVIIRKYDPVVTFSVGDDVFIRGVMLKNAIDCRDSNVVSVVERFNIFRGYVLIAKNPHLFGLALLCDRTLPCFFLGTKRVHQLRMLIVVLSRSTDLCIIKPQLVGDLRDAPLTLSD
nr:hypothetical protein [Halomicroarcula salinisoli]